MVSAYCGDCFRISLLINTIRSYATAFKTGAFNRSATLPDFAAPVRAPPRQRSEYYPCSPRSPRVASAQQLGVS